MCTSKEHQAGANNPAQPSYCTLPIFHAPLDLANAPSGGVGYVSGDGHHFGCRNPTLLQQAFHVIFVIDRSSSMGCADKKPLTDTPTSTRIAARHNNRIGAVYSSLYAFWSTRNAVANGNTARRDAYSVILFNHGHQQILVNDFTSTPDRLLEIVLPHGASGGTNYTSALQLTQTVMDRNWSTERAPVVVFLSDGKCGVDDSVTRDLSRRAIALGRALSFHAVSFGPHNSVLRRMPDIASDVQRSAPPDPMHPAVPSSYVEALDFVRLAESFIGIANSLTKPRGGLMHK